MISKVLVLAALSSLAAAQDTGVAAIQAHFEQAGLTPGFIATFEPLATLDVAFGPITITPGQPMTIDDVQPVPELTLTPADPSAEWTGEYTVAMVDAEVVGFDTSNVNRHWLINGATIQDNQISTETASAITTYAAPFPAEGSGPHRYVILVYAQPEGFVAPESPPPESGVEPFDWNAYVEAAQLTGPVAANYIQVEQGTATVELSATSVVASSTLAPASTSASEEEDEETGTASTSEPTDAPNSSIQHGFNLSAVFGVAFGIIFLF